MAYVSWWQVCDTGSVVVPRQTTVLVANEQSTNNRRTTTALSRNASGRKKSEEARPVRWETRLMDDHIATFDSPARPGPARWRPYSSVFSTVRPPLPPPPPRWLSSKCRLTTAWIQRLCSDSQRVQRGGWVLPTACSMYAWYVQCALYTVQTTESLWWRSDCVDRYLRGKRGGSVAADSDKPRVCITFLSATMARCWLVLRRWLLRKFSGFTVLWCIGPLVHWSSGSLVLWFVSSLLCANLPVYCCRLVHRFVGSSVMFSSSDLLPSWFSHWLVPWVNIYLDNWFPGVLTLVCLFIC